jgi:hypothetical protein
MFEQSAIQMALSLDSLMLINKMLIILQHQLQES